MGDAIFSQLTSLYRDGSLLRETIEQAAAEKDGDRAALAEQRVSLAKEIARAERAIERYHDAFENGELVGDGDQLGRTITNRDPDQAKALLRILIADLRVNSRSEVLPTYRVGAPVVCAQQVQWS
jgi:hypothetical protein